VLFEVCIRPPYSDETETEMNKLGLHNYLHAKVL